LIAMYFLAGYEQVLQVLDFDLNKYVAHLLLFAGDGR